MSNFKVGDTYYNSKVSVGTKIKFRNEKQRYTVIASNHFFSICTKPFNAKKTMLYTIIDWHEQIRGTENLVFGMGAETKEQCEEMLERLTQGETEISHRNNTTLKIESFEDPQFVKIRKKDIAGNFKLKVKKSNMITVCGVHSDPDCKECYGLTMLNQPVAE